MIKIIVIEKGKPDPIFRYDGSVIPYIGTRFTIQDGLRLASGFVHGVQVSSVIVNEIVELEKAIITLGEVGWTNVSEDIARGWEIQSLARKVANPLAIKETKNKTAHVPSNRDYFAFFSKIRDYIAKTRGEASPAENRVCNSFYRYLKDKPAAFIDISPDRFVSMLAGNADRSPILGVRNVGRKGIEALWSLLNEDGAKRVFQECFGVEFPNNSI